MVTLMGFGLGLGSYFLRTCPQREVAPRGATMGLFRASLSAGAAFSLFSAGPNNTHSHTEHKPSEREQYE